MRQKKRVICVAFIIIVQCVFAVMWGMQKERLNIDEVFSYEGAKNKGYAMLYWDKDVESFYGKDHTKAEFEEHITVYRDELLITKPLELTKSLIYRETYYAILNLSVTFAPGVLTKWTGIGLNLFFFVLTQIVFYQLALKICSSFRCALFVVLIYGLSAGGISTILYIRCYMLLVLLLMLGCLCYIKSVESKRGKTKVLYLVLGSIAGVCCAKIHPFGMLAFVILICGILIYKIISKRDKYVLYGLIIFLMLGIVGVGFCFKSMPELVEIFRTNISALSIQELAIRSRKMFIVLSKHLCYPPMMLPLVILPIVYAVVRKWKRKEVKAKARISIIIGLCIVSYLITLILGRAIEWKYVSIAYPFICLVWIMLSDIESLSQKSFVMILVAFISVTGISYYSGNISELFKGEREQERFFEENYADVNGIMIHADGAGENWLYEAAYLWPYNTRVNVQLLSTLRESDVLDFPQDEENEILLWLTIDYDNAEVMRLFMEKTSFTHWKPVYSTDSLRVYLCSK